MRKSHKFGKGNSERNSLFVQLIELRKPLDERLLDIAPMPPLVNRIPW